MTAEPYKSRNEGFKFINLWQTKEERKEKYHLARSCGANSSWAARMRDWRLSKIERRYNLTPQPALKE